MTYESLRWAAAPALLWMSAASGQPADPPVLEEIIVTATKQKPPFRTPPCRWRC